MSKVIPANLISYDSLESLYDHRYGSCPIPMIPEAAIIKDAMLDALGGDDGGSGWPLLPSAEFLSSLDYWLCWATSLVVRQHPHMEGHIYLWARVQNNRNVESVWAWRSEKRASDRCRALAALSELGLLPEYQI